MTTGGTDPYLNARVAWRDQAAKLVQGRTLWATMSLILGIGLLMMSAAYIHLSSQSRRVPWIIEQDCSGALTTRGELPANTEVAPKHIVTALNKFVSAIRLVTPDIDVQNNAIRQVYSMLATQDPTLAQTTELLGNLADPRERSKTVLVSTEIVSTMHHVGNEWEIVWLETTRTRKGKLSGKPQRWRGLFSIYQNVDSLAKDDNVKNFNPLGLFVREYRWEKFDMNGDSK